MDLLLELIFVVGISVLAHGVIAYVLAPRKAKQGILDAISLDVHFQELLMRSLIQNASKPMQWKDANGQDITRSPIELLASIISGKFQADFKSYLGGKQSEMIRDLEGNAQNAMQMMPDNPMVALAMSQIPKKYLAYVQILMNLMQPR